jgi:hypothetical protein
MLYPAPSLQPIAAVRRGMRAAAFFERLGMIRCPRPQPDVRPRHLNSGPRRSARAN